MALHRGFPTSLYAPLIPEQQWFPADEAMRATAYEKLLSPLGLDQGEVGARLGLWTTCHQF
jgi:hypothetical protein